MNIEGDVIMDIRDRTRNGFVDRDVLFRAQQDSNKKGRGKFATPMNSTAFLEKQTLSFFVSQNQQLPTKKKNRKQKQHETHWQLGLETHFSFDHFPFISIIRCIFYHGPRTCNSPVF